MSSTQQILEKAIQKAIDGGWRPDLKDKVFYPKISFMLISPYCIKLSSVNQPLGRGMTDEGEVFIFNHDFAKALWGEDKYAVATEGVYDGRWIVSKSEYEEEHQENTWKQYTPLWQHHLQQMVIADDPIKYLGENI